MNADSSSAPVTNPSSLQRLGVEINAPNAFAKRLTNAILIGIPSAGSVWAILLIWNGQAGWIELICFLFFYLVTGIGIGLGFHRYATHQAFQPARPLKLVLVFLGSLAFQGSVIRWVADHRRHHRLSDREYDTHSPLFDESNHICNRVAGLWHAHIGWMFDRTTTNYAMYAPDLLSDADCRWFHRHYVFCTVSSLFLPFVFGSVLGNLNIGWNCLFIGGCLRAATLHHVIWGVNSFGHTFGRQDASTRDSSRNSFLMALLTFGEGWHNNHHAAPRSAWNQWKWYQMDFNGWLIVLLQKCHLVTNVVYPDAIPQSLRNEDAIPVSKLEEQAHRQF